MPCQGGQRYTSAGADICDLRPRFHTFLYIDRSVAGTTYYGPYRSKHTGLDVEQRFSSQVYVLGEQKAGEVGVRADSVVYLYLSLVNDPPASEPNLKLYRPKAGCRSKGMGVDRDCRRG